MLRQSVVRWWRRITLAVWPQQGQGLIEYALIIGLIALAVVGGVSSFGGSVQAMYETIQTVADAL